MNLPLTGFRVVLLALFLGLSLPFARAFPPAPDGLIYGVVRDQYGAPLADPSDTIILQTPGGVQVVGTLQPGLAIGVNYALRVPMDVGLTPVPYTANALVKGAQFKLYVVVGTTTNLPLEMTGAYLSLALPSQRTLQNLTLGTDANGDGVPDAWEMAFLASLGNNLALTNINGNAVYTGDGRTLKQEYLLGNFPYSSNAFNVTLVSQNAGSAVLAFTTTATPHTYSVLGSSDLQNWTALAFTIPAAGAGTQTSYYATTAQPLQIQTVQPATAPQMQFFRLQLQ